MTNPCPQAGEFCRGPIDGGCSMSAACPHYEAPPAHVEPPRTADDEALRQEIAGLSFRHAALDLFLRSPNAQRVSDAERAAMRHQLRAYDDALYWLRQRVRVRGMA